MLKPSLWIIDEFVEAQRPTASRFSPFLRSRGFVSSPSPPGRTINSPQSPCPPRQLGFQAPAAAADAAEQLAFVVVAAVCPFSPSRSCFASFRSAPLFFCFSSLAHRWRWHAHLPCSAAFSSRDRSTRQEIVSVAMAPVGNMIVA